MNTARFSLAGAGTQTAGLAFGGSTGSVTSATESWNGTSWTSNPTGLATARQGLGAAGTQTLALAIGGYNGPILASTEEWTSQALQVRTITTS
jgi:hypothetical protein